MRQGIGTDLLGPNDPRGASIGILYVSPSDDRKNVLAALITQEKLGRKQVVVQLPDLNAAFRRPADFEDLKGLRRRLKIEIIFIAPRGIGPAEFARQRGFPVYSTLEDYAQALRNGDDADGEDNGGGGKILSFLNRGRSRPGSESKDDTAAAPATPAVPASPTPSSAPDPLLLGGAGGLAAGLAAGTAMNAHAPAPNAQTSAPTSPPAGGSATVTSPAGSGTNGKRVNGGTTGAEDKPLALPNRGKPTGKLPTAGPVGVPLSPPPQPAARGSTGPAPVVRGTSGSGSGRTTASGSAGAPPVPPGGYWPPTPQPTPAELARRRRNRIIGGGLLLLLLLLVACGSVAYEQPQVVTAVKNALLPSPNVTVTVVAASQTVSSNYVVAGVTGAASASQSQISIRQLSYTTPAQTAKVTGTGKGVVNGVEATGTLTFQNGLPTSYEYGTTTAFTASNGVSFYLDVPVTIPAADPQAGTLGKATGTAHAGTTGVAGNIAADAISITRGAIYIENFTPFTGGVDPAHYTFIQQSDVDAAVKGIQGAVDASAQKGLSAQLQSGDVLVNKVQCAKPTKTVDQPVGDKGPSGSAKSGTVSVTETCTGQAYKQADLTALVTTLLGQTATKSGLGPPYALFGSVLTTITTLSSGPPVQLSVAAKGVYGYVFTDAQKKALANAIKGLSAAQAVSTLQGQTGVSSASVQGGVTTLPGDPNLITIDVQEPSGFSGGGSAGPGTTPTVTGPGSGSPTAVTGQGSVPALV